jgi:hypothetical protein
LNNSETYSTPTNLTQQYLQVESSYRLVALGSFLRWQIANALAAKRLAKMVIFAATCAEVDFLHKVFSHAFWPDTDKNGRPLKEDDGMLFMLLLMAITLFALDLIDVFVTCDAMV